MLLKPCSRSLNIWEYEMLISLRECFLYIIKQRQRCLELCLELLHVSFVPQKMYFVFVSQYLFTFSSYNIYSRSLLYLFHVYKALAFSPQFYFCAFFTLSRALSHFNGGFGSPKFGRKIYGEHCWRSLDCINSFICLLMEWSSSWLICNVYPNLLDD